MADINKIKIGNDELDVTKKQDKIDSTHKLSADLVDDSSSAVVDPIPRIVKASLSSSSNSEYPVAHIKYVSKAIGYLRKIYDKILIKSRLFYLF